MIITCKEFERWQEQTEQASLSQHYEVPSGPSITEKDLPQENVSLYNPLNIFEPRRTARHSDVPVDTANNGSMLNARKNFFIFRLGFVSLFFLNNSSFTVADNALSNVRNNTPGNYFRLIVQSCNFTHSFL